MQLRACKALLKDYDEVAIIRALRDKEAWNIYSLRAPWLKDIIARHHKQVMAEREKIERTTIQKPPSSTIIPRRRTKPTALGKLKELDGEIDGEEKG
jgi:hypothetical protein